MTARCLMVLGSMSSVGKSMLVTGLCRLYARRGWRVAPFKAQNMSNNAAVCAGGEIGRAQASQAHAAGIEPTVNMNPILLKPEADSQSQVIVRGQVWKSISASGYYIQRDFLWQTVTESLDDLKSHFDLVILEGAGSPVEINLKKNDIVNLAAAHYAKAPCLLVGDIDRGGVFAQLLGNLWLLEEEDRRLIRGLIVNKFRGDLNLFSEGGQILKERGGVPLIGVVPFIKDHGIAEEDAATLDKPVSSGSGKAEITVIHFPHISNFDDIDPLLLEPDVQIRFVHRAEQMGRPSAIILPGTKNTLADLQWLHEYGLAKAIIQLAADNTPVVGFCGGFQMLGDRVIDENCIESDLMQKPGLGLLPITTRFDQKKTVTRSTAHIQAAAGFLAELQGQPIHGYEIHIGQTESNNPFCRIDSRESQSVQALDGACSENGKIWGTYLHGVLDNDNLRTSWLKSLGISASPVQFAQRRSQAYDHLADVLETALDIPYLDRIIAEGL